MAPACAAPVTAKAEGKLPMPTRTGMPGRLHHLNHFYSTRAVQVRAAIEPYRTWIENKLGVALSDAAVLYSDIELHNAAVKHVLAYIDPKAPLSTARVRVADLVQSVELPYSHVPLFDLTLHRVSGRAGESLVYGAEDSWAYEIEWTDGPVLLHLRDLPTPVIALCAAYHGGPESDHESREDILIIPKHGLEPLITLLKSLHVSDRKARLKVGHSPARAVTECSWDSLTLEPSIVSLLRDDFEMFFERERWFRDMQLPFRRGYLLHGPPGTGKSTAIRAMMSSRGLAAYTMRFFSPRLDDEDLDNLFASAAQNAPSMVVLEDIDRVFPRAGQSKTQISLQALLNALDGVGSSDAGLITVATANEPTALDPAILKRPGRFDRVVCFPLPSIELRYEYFRKLKLSFDDADLEAVVEETEDMSYAQLREIHVMAGQKAFIEARRITGEDLLYAVWTMRQSLSFKKLRTTSPGFVEPRGRRGE